MRKLKSKIFIVMFILVMSTLLAATMTAKKRATSSAQAADVAPQIQSHVAATPPAVCDGFDIRPDAHIGDKVVTEGLKGDANQVRNAALEEARHNTAELRLLWNSSPLASAGTINSEGDLDDGHGCLTADARQKWLQLKGAIMSATVVNEPAPADGTNTGANGSGAYQVANVADEGDGRMATRVTYQNGKSVWVLHRCGNVVVNESSLPGGKIPNIPEGGKNAGNDVLVNPNLPGQIGGCSAAGCGGNTAGPPYQPQPPPPPPRPRPVPPATTVPGPSGGTKPVATAPQPPAPAG